MNDRLRRKEIWHPEVLDVIKPYRLARWHLAKVCGQLLGAVTSCALVWFMVTSALAQDAERGRHIAERWCSSCHLADGHGPSRSEAPSFASIGAQHRDNDLWVRAWLMAPHPSMPDMNLSRPEIADIVAYLKTLHQSK
jgi:mono/diheme cytochrome c family protein